MGGTAKIVETRSGSVTDTKQFVGGEERDSGGTVTRQFLSKGEIISGAFHFFSFDHLGSVREVADLAGTLQARYEYDPYGRTTRLAGSVNADFQYAGMYMHAPSGFYLTPARQYDTVLGIWLSRDPLDGSSYSYAAGNPIYLVDRSGLLADVSATQNGNYVNVDITIPLWFLGDGMNSTLAGKIHNGIVNTWSGTFKGGGKTYCVHTSVVIRSKNTNRIWVPQWWYSRSAVLETFANPNEISIWPVSALNYFGAEVAAAHEAGHLMGLSDAYLWGLPGTGPGIMGGFPGVKPTAADIQEILRIHGYNF